MMIITCNANEKWKMKTKKEVVTIAYTAIAIRYRQWQNSLLHATVLFFMNFVVYCLLFAALIHTIWICSAQYARYVTLWTQTQFTLK